MRFTQNELYIVLCQQGRQWLVNADLSGANLNGANLFSANLRGAKLCWADLSNADLRESDLCGGDLRGARLHWTRLGWADLSQTNLCGVDLSQILLRDFSASDRTFVITLNDAIYDESTKWPDGFDPIEAGAIMVGESGKPISHEAYVSQKPMGLQMWQQNLEPKPTILVPIAPVIQPSQILDEVFQENDTIQSPQREEITFLRIVRDTKKSRKIKKLYQYTCQICGLRIQGVAGPYAEGAHIRPLGQPHNGLDSLDNLLCLCPNHHTMFDLGVFTINADLTLNGIEGKVFALPQHKINLEHLKYHRELYKT